MAEKLVPPAPPTSNPSNPSLSRINAESWLKPVPTSLAIIGVFLYFSRSFLKLLLKSLYEISPLS